MPACPPYFTVTLALLAYGVIFMVWDEVALCTALQPCPSGACECVWQGHCSRVLVYVGAMTTWPAHLWCLLGLQA